MGALHEGHLSLVRAARAQNDKVVCSIFVNPKQFAAHEDLGAYPKTLEGDLKVLREAGVDLVFTPSADEMYPTGFATVVDPGPSFTSGSAEGGGCAGEGGARPHFFKGVATACTKLFNVVQPSRAYFGQKDAVQCAVLAQVVSDLAIPTELVVVPTVRASDGLALSSRNAYLSPKERQASPKIFVALCEGAKVFQKRCLELGGGVGTASVLRSEIEEAVRLKLAEEPVFVKVEYISIVGRTAPAHTAVAAATGGSSANSSREIPLQGGRVSCREGAVVSVAVVTADGVRLIDNIVLSPAEELADLTPPSTASVDPSSIPPLASSQHSSNHPLVPLPPDASPSPRRLTAMDITRKWRRGGKLSMVTAYSAPMGAHVDAAGADMVLVGDSVGMVELGHRTTVGVTLEDMLHHAKAVRKGVKRALVVVDLPFGSYELSPEQALASAHRLVKECGADAVKVEGGAGMAPTVARLVNGGVAVVGHVGLTPQACGTTGGFRAQGRTSSQALRVVADALALEAAGAFAVVVECVPGVVAQAVSERLGSCPTIGIGAGGATGGQVLVFHDLVGMSRTSAHHEEVTPRFCKRYASVGEDIQRALRSYVDEVGSGAFPSKKFAPYAMSKGEETEFLAQLAIFNAAEATSTEKNENGDSSCDAEKIY